MNDDECKIIETKAYFHLCNCVIDDSLIGMDELKTAFKEVTKNFKELQI